MGKLGFLILKIFLGVLAAANLAVCIVTTDLMVLAVVNLGIILLGLGLLGFMATNISRLATELGISPAAASELIGAYFVHYKNVGKISLDEYLALRRRAGQGLTGRAAGCR